jgi:colanic acid/amylovoran biosynthesis glycosyltransferase
MKVHSNGKISVVHFAEHWLPQTATWLYNNINFLPETIENAIVCQDTQNLEQFRLQNISAFSDLPLSGRFIGKFRYKLGMVRPLGIHLNLLNRVLQNSSADILHTHFGHYGWVNYPVAKRNRVKHVVSFYGADIHYIPKADRRWESRYRTMFEEIDQVLCEGPYMADSISKLGLPPEKIHVYRLGIDLKKIEFRPRQNPEGGILRILIAGSFREKKGIPYAIEALGLYRRKNKNIEVTIIGDADHINRSIQEKERILEAIRKFGMESSVRMLGYQPHEVLLQEAYCHHIFLSPSVISEDGDCEGGAPVSIIEMAASGMPVVSTLHCDIPYMLSAQNQPFLVPERNSEALCVAIETLYKSDWAEIIQANRVLIEQELDVRKQASKLAGIYKLLLK